jgi:hypothetical protein
LAENSEDGIVLAKNIQSSCLAVKKQIKHRIFAVINQGIHRIIDLEQWQNTFTNIKTGQTLPGMIKP